VKALVALPLVLALGAATPLPGIPRYAQPYKSWTKLNAKPIPRRSADAHDGTKNVYASKLPPRGSTRYPVGSVIVKEGFRPGKRFVGLIAVMRKVKATGLNNGWVMIEWVRSSANARFTEIARGQICYSCHVGAKKTDYVFTKRR
jgi:hypothetical protein